jgi:hypothetical protein
MNEILAPIYYCLSKETTPFIKNHLEEIAFYTFQGLMGTILENFIKSLD